MTSYLLDTHVWSWSLLSGMLHDRAVELLKTANPIQINAISLYEIRQKVRIGKWPEMEPYAARLVEMLERQGVSIVEISAPISDLAGSLDWDHRDPFDRLIAATAIVLRLPLISADTAFDQLSDRKDWPGRVW